MSNELLIKKPWWRCSILWLFTLAVIIGIATISTSLFVDGNMDFYALANADPSFYEVALDSANNNQRVVEHFGHLKALGKQEIYEGKAFYSNNKNSLNIVLPVTGTKKNGNMVLWLHRYCQGWKYDSVIVKKSDVKITVVKAKEAKPVSSILGKWKILKRISLDENIPLSEKESLECSGSLVTFTKSSFSITKNSCFIKYDCQNPKYKIQITNTDNYFENDKSLIKLLGLKDSVKVLTSDCSVPFASVIILDSSNICFGMDGYEYYLNKVK